MKPVRWKDPSNKIFEHQVGFTSPPCDFDACATDFIRMSPDNVGAHARLMHVGGEYAHELNQRGDNFHLLDDAVHALSNGGCDVVGQVGTNWVHCGGRTPKIIRAFCDELSDKYETPFHMAGMCLVEGLREMNAEKIALNAGYFWPDWRDGVVRFLKDAGFDVVYYGNFVDQGFYNTQQEVNDRTWIFPEDLAAKSFQYVAEQAPNVDAIVINGMPNFRNTETGICNRPLWLIDELEQMTGKPIVSSDNALYWNIYKSLGVQPVDIAASGSLLNTLRKT
jgi:maleate cis-trans isomerase